MAKVESFRFWCQKVLPLVYDESLSYYELLCKVVEYLNNTIAAVNENTDDVAQMRVELNQFEAFINNYFDNLNVQTEINNKLDAMAESGELTNIMKPYIDTMTAGFNTRITAAQTTADIANDRIDEILGLDPGSTSLDAEVVDIRVAAYGGSYSSAGNSVRSQIRRISDTTRNLSNLKEIKIGEAWNTSSNSARAVLYVPFTGSTAYTISYTAEHDFDKLMIYEKSSAEATTNLYNTDLTNGYTRTSNAACAFLVIQFNKEGISASDFNNFIIQVEEGTKVTPYIDHVSGLDKFVRNDITTYVTPEMYGAWGDGVHDDKLALQAALDSGKEVRATGNYLISNSITMSTDYQKFYFNKIVCNTGNPGLKVDGRFQNIEGNFLQSNSDALVIGSVKQTYNCYIKINFIKSTGGIGVKIGGPEPVSEVIVDGTRIEYYANGVYFDLENYWVGQVVFKNMNISTEYENAGYAFFANGQLHPLTGLTTYNVSLEGAHGGFQFINSQSPTPIETLNCFGLRTSEMSIRDGYNVLRYTGSGVIRGVMCLDAAMLESFVVNEAPNFKECYIVMGRLMKETTGNIYGMAIGNVRKISPIRLAELVDEE